MKVCKIYCTYFGERGGKTRRTAGPTNATEALEVFQKNINHDHIFDCGVDEMDIIVMNNESKTITQEGVNYLNKINGMTTPYGKIIVHNRKNIGGSLGAYSEAFDLYENEYDYWFFCEDDISVIYERYFELIVNEFKDEKLGFLAFNKIVHDGNPKKTYVGGALGASSGRILSELKMKQGKLNYDVDPHSTKNYGGFGHSELYFTNPILKLGYEIRIPLLDPDIVPLADNWRHFDPQARWQKEKNFDLKNKKFLVHFGL